MPLTEVERVRAGVVLAFATLPEKPLAVMRLKDVTVPPEGVDHMAGEDDPAEVNT